MSFSPQLRSSESGPQPSSGLPSDVNENTPVLATSYNPTFHTSQDLGLRSCITCRRRKVRCNKRSPCSNCAKAGVECIFPPPGRAPRKSKRPQDAELLSRLKRLEGVIEHLSEKKVTTANANSPASPLPQSGPSHLAGGQEDQARGGGEENCPFMDPNRRAQPRALEHEFGRLVIDEGRSRYVSNRFWASLGDEIEELQDILDPSSSDEEDHPSPESSSSHSTNHDGFLFGFHSLSHSLRNFYPSSSQLPAFWSLYKQNVAPILPIVWMPTAQKLFDNTPNLPDSLDKNSEALALSMYFVTIISASNEQCLSILGESRNVAVTRYRFAVEQALARANLLNTQSLMLLQAAVIFLNAVRREDDTKFVWSMTALILRLAQGLGLHRDGNNFGLKPFDTEMRRRLWWTIVLLDLRSSEDHGTDVQIHERMSDTRLPLNVNDDNLSPDMQEPPKEQEGFTDTTCLLMRAEISVAMRRVSYTCPVPNKTTPGQKQNPPDRCGNVIQAINKRIEERYIRHCDINIPIQWLSATMSRLVLTKMWLIIHHPLTRPDRPLSINNASRESLFVTSVELAEFARLLSADKNTAQWNWMLATHMQWHALAFVLSELCVRPLCPMTDRAWIAVSTLYDDWIRSAKQRKGMLWRPLARLMKRAAAFRAKQQEELQGQYLAQETRSRSTPTTEQSIVGTPYLPQIPEIQPPTAPLPLNRVPSSADLDIDMSQGPIGVISHFFPDVNWLATPSPENSNPQAGFVDRAVPVNPAINPPPAETQQDAPNLQLNWEDWDQVMREFQVDMQEESGNPVGHTQGFFS